MPRCDYDVVFYRVFCITLLGVAFAFTVILTNVFLDIDGLLFNKNKEKQSNLETVKSDVIRTSYLPPDTVYDDYEAYDTERTKRSLESEDIIQQIKDTQLKNKIKRRLFNLIDQISEETDKKDNRSKQKDKSNTKYNKNNKKNEDLLKETRNSEEKDIFKGKDIKNKDSEEKDTNVDLIKDIQRLKNKKDMKKNDEMLHLAIHNVILQGIVKPRDLKDERVQAHELATKLDNSEENGKHDDLSKYYDIVSELMDCKKLQNAIANKKTKEMYPNDKKKNQNIMIRTLINITSLFKDNVVNKIHDDSNSKETLNGTIKLIFNGKEYIFKNIEVLTTEKPQTNKQTNTYVPNVYTKNIFNEYLKKIKDINIVEYHNNRHKRNSDIEITYDFMAYLKQDENINSEYNPNIRYKRNHILKKYLNYLKQRQIEKNYNNNHIISKRNTLKTKEEKPKRKDDDELFVEIETHFDNKGMKGDRKKKLIKDLVSKIQKAIYSENPVNEASSTKREHKNLHVKKRIQSPLDGKESVLAQSLPKITEKFGHRSLDPISKIISLQERTPIVSSHDGDNWKYDDPGPKFLAHTKSINSAERNEYETDYKQVLETEIPQRLQVPLMADENPNFYDLGNVRFLVKNIDDSGFSIGYNQYRDEAPDADAMKLFTGLENVIQTYHQKYDVDESIKENDFEHQIVKRSLKDTAYHSNEYKIIFNNNFVPFNNYQDKYNQKIIKKLKEKRNKKKVKTLVLDESIFSKELKPSEMFSLANFFNRKKRAYNVKKISNIKTIKKINKYLNTKVMNTKRYFLHKKRNKRQVDKIRIIARDLTPKNSEEEIFVVSDEKILANRAVIKDIGINTPDIRSVNEKEVVHEHYDVITPQKVTEEHFDIITPYIYEAPKENSYSDVFNKISRHNALMSKYPHIFTDEVNKEDDYESLNKPVIVNIQKEEPDLYATTVSTVDINYNDHNNYLKPIFDDYGYFEPQGEKKNYKVTVKITPKNSTSHSGFKEIHTSINKSFNQNGLLYTSLVNVSELSKVEKANKAKEFKLQNLNTLTEVHNKIKHLIEKHKTRLEEQLALLNNENEKLNDIDINLDANGETYPNNNNNSKNIPPEDKEVTKTKEPNVESTTNTTTIASTTTTTTEANINTYTTTYETTTPNIEKLIMFSSIQKNENITNQILTKINKNNELLQTFLEKIASNLITTTPKTTETTKTTLPEPYEQIQNIFFKNMPRGVKNDAMGVPFVYMYQHPSNLTREPANILYHGHIHSDAYKQFLKYNQNDLRRTNMKEEETKPYFAKPTNRDKWRNISKPPNFDTNPNFVKPNFVDSPNFAKTPNVAEDPNFAKPPHFDPNPNFVKPYYGERPNFAKTPNVVEATNFEKTPNVVERNNFVKLPNFVEAPNFAKTPNVVKRSNFAKPPIDTFIDSPKFVKIPNFGVKNDTKFFLDDVNDYKVISVDNKNYYNTTKT